MSIRKTTKTQIGSVLPGGTEGSVLFVGANNKIAQDNSALFWNDTDNKLGVGTNTPAYQIHAYTPTGIAEIRVESGEAASTRFLMKNPANSWNNAVDSAGDYVFQDVSAGSTSIIKAFKGAPDKAFRINVSELSINENGVDYNFRVEAVDMSNALFVEGSTGDIGMGTGSPADSFHVYRTTGNASFKLETIDPAYSQAKFILRNKRVDDVFQVWSFTSGTDGAFTFANSTDATNPFQIFPGAATQSIYVTSTDITMNQGKADRDFRVKTPGSNLAIIVNAGTERVGIFANPTSSFYVNGSVGYFYIAKTANYTLTETDYQIECTANTFTITLPTAVGIQGRVYSIKNSGTGTITIDADGTQTIDGELTQTIEQWENIKIMSTNSNWIII